MKVWLSVIGITWLAATGAWAGGLTTGTDVPYPTQWSPPQILPNGRILPPMPTHFATQSAGVSYQANGNVAPAAGSTNSLVLLMAAERGDTNTIKLLLAQHVNIETTSPAGFTALIVAALREQLPALRLLLERGADINAATRAGQTALVVAVINGHTEVVKLLLDNKADPMVMDETGKMAVDYAIAAKRADLIELLKAPPAK